MCKNKFKITFSYYFEMNIGWKRGDKLMLFLLSIKDSLLFCTLLYLRGIALLQLRARSELTVEKRKIDFCKIMSNSLTISNVGMKSQKASEREEGKLAKILESRKLQTELAL